MLALCAGAASTSARAARPLATDDAGVADTGTCQLEAWYGSARADRAIVLAPACGIAAGWELGGDAARAHEQGQTAAAVAVAAKWVPAVGMLATPVGPLTLGLKASTARAREQGSGWDALGHSVLALATLEATPNIVLHFNLGAVRDAALHASGTLLNAALAWSAGESALLFAEVQANDRSALFGGAIRTAGARWWLVKDTLGLDFTASRQAGSDSGTRWSFGFGWYGLFGDR